MALGKSSLPDFGLRDALLLPDVPLPRSYARFRTKTGNTETLTLG